MWYPYKCATCETVTEISKPMCDSDKEEHCPQCKTELKRVYEAVGISTSDGIKN